MAQGGDRYDVWLKEEQERDRQEEDRARRFRLSTRRSEISAGEDLAAGAMRGLAKTGTSTVRGLGWITDKLSGGRFGKGAEEWANQADKDVEEYTGVRSGDTERYDPGTAGVAGEVMGRLAGETATMVAGGGAVRSGLRALSSTPLPVGIPEAAGAITRTLDRLGRGGAVARTTAQAAPFLPVDVVQGAGGAVEDENGQVGGIVLPGRAGAAAENVAMGFVPTLGIEAGIGAYRGARQARAFEEAMARAEQRAQPFIEAKRARANQPPGPITDPKRLLNAAPEPEVAGPAIPMGAETVYPREAPETRPERLLPERSQPMPIADTERAGPGIAQPAVPTPDEELFPGLVPPSRRLARGPLVTPPPAPPTNPLDEAVRMAAERRAQRPAEPFNMDDFVSRGRGEPTAAEADEALERAAIQGENPAQAKNEEGLWSHVRAPGGAYRDVRRVSREALLDHLSELADERLGTRFNSGAAKSLQNRLDTVEAELERRGMTQDQIWTSGLEEGRARRAAAEEAARKRYDEEMDFYFGADPDGGGAARRGAARFPVIRTLAGAGAGAAVGGTQGDTPEEHMLGAVGGAAVGAGVVNAPSFLGRIMENARTARFDRAMAAGVEAATRAGAQPAQAEALIEGFGGVRERTGAIRNDLHPQKHGFQWSSYAGERGGWERDLKDGSREIIAETRGSKATPDIQSVDAPFMRSDGEVLGKQTAVKKGYEFWRIDPETGETLAYEHFPTRQQAVEHAAKFGGNDRGPRLQNRVGAMGENAITAAAVQMRDGKIFTGPTHADALKVARAAGSEEDVVFEGYTTKLGRLVNADAASRVATVEPSYASAPQKEWFGLGGLSRDDRAFAPGNQRTLPAVRFKDGTIETGNTHYEALVKGLDKGQAVEDALEEGMLTNGQWSGTIRKGVKPWEAKAGGLKNRTGAVGTSQPQGAEGGRPWLRTAKEDGPFNERLYSRLENAIAAAPFEKGSAQQWKAALSKNVSKNEKEWTGIESWLDAQGTRTITRDEVGQQAAAKRINFGEKRFGSSSNAARGFTGTWGRNGSALITEKPHAGPNGETRWQVFGPDSWGVNTFDSIGEAKDYVQSKVRSAVSFAERRSDFGKPRFETYTLPGGDNYREIVMTLDRPVAAKEPLRWNPDEDDGGFLVSTDHPDGDITLRETRNQTYMLQQMGQRWGPYNTIGEAQAAAESLPRSDEGAGTFRAGSHWPGVDNPIAHVRLKDRVGPNGEKVLHVEEVQSDWHEQGRERGYKGVDDPAALKEWHDADAVYKAAGDKLDAIRARGNDRLANNATSREWAQMSEEYRIAKAEHDAALAARDAAEARLKPMGGRVPNAPFKKTDEWTELALKRVLQEAVDGGYDRVVFTPGVEQAKRYLLARKVDKLTYNPETAHLEAWRGGSIIHSGNYDPKALSDVVGKEYANKLLESPLNRKSATEKVTEAERAADLEFGVFTQKLRRSRLSEERQNALLETVRSEGDPASFDNALDDVPYDIGVAARTAWVKRNAARAEGDLGNVHVLEGEDLRVGGAGMRAYYDRIVPKVIKDYAKSLGVDLEVAAGKTATARTLTEQEIDQLGMREFQTGNEDVAGVLRMLSESIGNSDGGEAWRPHLDAFEQELAHPGIGVIDTTPEALAGARRVLEAAEAGEATDPAVRIQWLRQDLAGTKERIRAELRGRRAGPMSRERIKHIDAADAVLESLAENPHATVDMAIEVERELWADSGKAAQTRLAEDDGFWANVASEITMAQSHYNTSAAAEKAGAAWDSGVGFTVTPELKAAVKKGQRVGATRQAVTNTLAGGVAGTVAGSAVGDTPEDRRVNAVFGGVMGLAAGGASAVALERAAGRTAKAAAAASTPALARAAQTVAAGERAVGKKATFLTNAEKAYTDIVDETLPLSKFGRTFDKAGNPERLAETVAQGQGHVLAGRQYLDDTLKPILQTVKGREADLEAYLVARREQQLRTQGAATKTDMTDGEIAAAVRDGDRDPVIKRAADDLTALYRDLLDRRLKAGLLTQDKYDAIVKSEDFYTPFVREWGGESAAGGGIGGGGKFTNRGSGVRTMDRKQMASAKITSPLEQAVLDVSETFRQVAKQNVTNVVAEIVQQNPGGVAGLIREVPAGSTKTPTARTVQAMVGGERKTYEVVDKDLFDAWAAFDHHTMGLAEKIGNVFKRTLQGGVTLLPDFAAANLLRDTGQSVIQQGARRIVKEAAGGAAVGFAAGAATADPDESRVMAGLRGAGFGAGLATLAPQAFKGLKAVSEVMREAPVYQEFLRSGAATMGFYPRNTKDARKVLQELKRSGVALSDVINPGRWLDALHFIGQATEQGTRLAKWKDVTKAGATPARAALESQDVSLRFANIGRRTKGIASVTAFWNAKVQGWDKLARLIKDPRTAAAGVATITAPSMALWSVNKDNPEYWDRPQWERNMFWLVPKGDGGFWRIPKPFEIGFLFASLPERLGDYAVARSRGMDAQPGETLASAARDMASTTFDGTVPMPTAIGTAMEETANYDMFRNRPIVTRPELPAGMQQDERSSFIGRTLGERFGISPQRFDHLVRSLSGSTGQMVSAVADAVARRTGLDDRAEPADDTPLLMRRFVTNDAGLTDQETAVRRRWDAANRVYAGARNLERDVETAGADPEKLRQYVESHRPELEARSQLEQVIKALDELTARRRALRKDRAVGRQQRKEELQALRLLGQEIANLGLGPAPAATTARAVP